MDKEFMQAIREIIKSELEPVKAQLDEHTQLLRAIEHKTDVIAAEQENLKHEVAEVKGEVKSLRKDLAQVEIVTANNWADIAKLKLAK
jgi:chromosome segregation ATPase